MSSARAVGSFEGFPKQTLAFYKAVAANNNREWFEEHRDDYISAVIAPSQAFVAAAGPKLQKLSPGVRFDPDYNGKGSIKRIFTDQRFRDRDPYKTYLDIMFWEGPLASKKDNSAFYFRLTPEAVHVVAGIKLFQRPVLKAYREAVVDPKRGPELDRILRGLGKHSFIEVLGRNLKQHPRGFDAGAKYAELLLHDGLYAVSSSSPPPADLHQSSMLAWCLERWKPMAPLHRWLVDSVLSQVSERK